MSKTIIVDANALGHRSNYATKLSVAGLQTQAVFGFVKTIRGIRVMYPDFSIICLWDGKAQWRFDMCPEYKSNRSSADPRSQAVREAYITQRPYIVEAMKALGVRQMKVATHEADDMAGYLVAQLSSKPENEVMLVTGDHDWIQLVRPNVTWHSLSDEGKVISHINFMNETGYATPYAFLEGKCLQGDSSDVISGVGGIGEKGAPEFLAEFGSVRKFWQRCDSGDFVPKKKAHVRLCSAEGRKIFGRNLMMMQLLKVAAPAKSDVTVYPGALDRDKFTDICHTLSFSSITKNIEEFISPFEGK